MASTKELPCPYCGVPIALRLRQFFPTRRNSIPCPHCRRRCLLPTGIVGLGLVGLLAWLVALVLIAKGAGFGHADTFPTLARDAALLLLGATFATTMACLLCRSLTTHLVKHPRDPR